MAATAMNLDLDLAPAMPAKIFQTVSPVAVMMPGVILAAIIFATVMLAIIFGMMVAPAFVRIIPSAAPAAAAAATVTVVIGEPPFKRAASPPVAGATLLRPTVL